MYCLFELMAAVCMVALIAVILFVFRAAEILVTEGVRNVLRLSAGCESQVATFLSTARTGWRITLPDQLGSLIPKEGKS